MKELLSLGATVTRMPSYKNANYFSALRSYFLRNDTRIVHSHVNAMSFLPLAAALSARVPVRIAHSHSTSSPLEPVRHALKTALRPLSPLFSNEYAACSEDAGRWQFGHRAFHEGRVRVIKNAIDLDDFSYDLESRSRKRLELGLKDEDFVLGHVGRLVRTKNQAFSLHIFERILKKYPRAYLLLVGDGDDRESLLSLSSDLGLEGRVIFAGSQERVSEFYQAMDAFVFPSLYEGLGMALVEAQVSGLPCVASSGVPISATVVESRVDFLPLAEGHDAWADSILGRRTEPRISFSQEAAARGFDIHMSSRELQDWYLTIARETPQRKRKA